MRRHFCRALVFLLSLILIIPPAWAQQPATNGQGAPPQVQRLINELHLTEEQTQYVLHVFDAHRPHLEKLARDRSAAPDKSEIDRQIKIEQDQMKVEVATILTPEQKILAARMNAAGPAPAASKRPDIPKPSGPPLAELEQFINLPATAPLSPDQKVLHLLNRLTFGPGPGDIDRVKNEGVAQFIDDQLHPERLDDGRLDERLAKLETLNMSPQELLAFSPPGDLLMRAQQQVKVDYESQSASPEAMAQLAKQVEARQKVLQDNARAVGVQLGSGKLLRAVYSNRQLQEVMVDFWFNHFNVFIGKDEERYFVPAYERDVIRPNVFGKFQNLLLAVAQSPAMLYYLDNWQSVSPDAKPPRQPFPELGRLYNPLNGPAKPPAPKPAVTPATPTQAPKQDSSPDQGKAQQNPTSGVASQPVSAIPGAASNAGRANPSATDKPVANPAQPAQAPPPAAAKPGPPRSRYGINENYARELMELHTLGVDGGYTQKDVVEVARCFTGWSMQPPRMGGYFVFRPWAHDNGEKTVLGVKIAAGGGMSDGIKVIDILVHQPATAHFIATKLCQRFVSDQPNEVLVKKVAGAFTKSEGDIRETLRALFTAPEFYAPTVFRAKYKSPLEFVASALRATDAYTDGAVPAQVVGQLGGALYQQQFPTGYPENSTKWVNTGGVLARLNQSIRLTNNGAAPSMWIDLDHLVSLSLADQPSQLVDALTKLVLHTNLKPNERDVLIKDVEAAQNSKGKVNPNQQVAQTLALVLGSPEFQRR